MWSTTSKTGGSAGSPSRARASNAAPGSPEPARWGQRWSYQLTPDGPEATIVTEIYDCSRAPADERVEMENGKIWAGAMAETLERLDALCARQGNQPGPS